MVNNLEKMEDDNRFTATPVKMFVCTLESKVTNIEFPNFSDFATRMCTPSAHPHIIAINSNFGHWCRPGYELFLKAKKVKKNADKDEIERASQGDGACFNSAVEPILTIQRLEVGRLPSKVYKIKFFPSTGRIQIPGIQQFDFSDGKAIMEVMLNYIKSELTEKFCTELKSFPVVRLKNPPIPKPKRKKLKKGAVEEEPIVYPEGEFSISMEPAKKITPAEIEAITYTEVQPILINTKFQFIVEPNDIIVVSNLYNIMSVNVNATETQTILTQINAVEMPITVEPEDIIKPKRGKITALNKLTEGKISFLLSIDNVSPTILFFQSGKVNILGSKNHETTSIIYDYLYELFEVYQEFIIVSRQMPDN